jgi:metal-responsive CopG/Arc/MetJ family transcriptional regulator
MKNNTKAVSITMPVAMYKDAEQTAKKENRTFSEYVREAIRQYSWERNMSEANRYGQLKAKELGIKEEDVVPLIKKYRQEQK